MFGLTNWWSGNDPEPSQVSLQAGWHATMDSYRREASSDRPADILSSARFAKAFAQMATQFDWIVCGFHSHAADRGCRNLWSRLVRTERSWLCARAWPRLKRYKKGLQALDSPKLIGVVHHHAVSGLAQADYHDQYYSAARAREKSNLKERDRADSTRA